jgi:hypothetical protein
VPPWHALHDAAAPRVPKPGLHTATQPPPTGMEPCGQTQAEGEVEPAGELAPEPHAVHATIPATPPPL